MLSQRPTQLHDCFGLARIVEEKNRRLAALYKPFRPPELDSTSMTSKRPPPPSRVDKRPPLLHHIPIILVARHMREKKRLCFNYDDKCGRGHKFKHLKVFIVENETNEEEQPPGGAQIEGDIDEKSIPEDVICHTLSDTTPSNSMRVARYVSECLVVVLLDTGSTHNFTGVATIDVLGSQTIFRSTFIVMVGLDPGQNMLTYIRHASHHSEHPILHGLIHAPFWWSGHSTYSIVAPKLRWHY